MFIYRDLDQFIPERFGGPGSCAMSYNNRIMEIRDGIKQRETGPERVKICRDRHTKLH